VQAFELAPQRRLLERPLLVVRVERTAEPEEMPAIEDGRAPQRAASPDEERGLTEQGSGGRPALAR
jgi:hypothetical protein